LTGREGQAIHGRRYTYNQGCRCAECAAANLAYGRERSRRLAEIEWGSKEPELIDAQPVKDHLRRLKRAGLSLVQLAELAGTSETTIKIMLGMKRNRPAHRVRTELADRILAITKEQLPEKGMVPSLGTRRRLQALVAIGYSSYQLAELMGTSASHVGHWMTREERILARTARRIAELYVELEMTQGPSDRARIRARRLSWHPPAAWDDPDTDKHPRI
jgi:transcriptional regulator with XRE-family HTH domain